MSSFAEYQIPRVMLRNADLAGKSVILRKPIPLEAVIADILRAEQTHEQVICEFDAMDFRLLNPNNFRTREVFSNGGLRGFYSQGGLYHPIVDEEADFVYYIGDVLVDSVENGRVLYAEKSFRALRTYIDQGNYNLRKAKVINQFKIQSKQDDSSNQSGNIRLL